MNLTYEKVAEVLEAVAEYVDGIEHEKQATVMTEKNRILDKIASQYEAATGEAFPVTMRDKLALLDQDALDHLTKVAHNNVGVPAALGEATEIEDKVPATVKEAAVKAEGDFLDWILRD